MNAFHKAGFTRVRLAHLRESRSTDIPTNYSSHTICQDHARLIHSVTEAVRGGSLVPLDPPEDPLILAYRNAVRLLIAAEQRVSVLPADATAEQQGELLAQRALNAARVHLLRNQLLGDSHFQVTPLFGGAL